MVENVLNTMKKERTRLKGNLKPNHFSLQFGVEYGDQNAGGNAICHCWCGLYT